MAIRAHLQRCKCSYMYSEASTACWTAGFNTTSQSSYRLLSMPVMVLQELRLTCGMTAMTAPLAWWLSGLISIYIHPVSENTLA